MSDLRAFLLESPIQLAVTLGIVEVLLISVWKTQRTQVTQRMALGGLVISVILVILSYWIETDGERVKATCRGLGQAVDAGDVDAFGALLADSFETEDWEKADLVAQMYRVLEKYTVDDVRIDRFRVDLAGERAAVSFRARAWVRNAPNVNPDFFSRWEAELIRENETDWRVQALKMIKYGPVDVNGLRYIMSGW